MNPAESRPGVTVMHGSESTRQRTASKLLVALQHVNTEQDSQVARDLPCEEHPRRWQHTAGKLGRTTGTPAPAIRGKGKGYEPCVLPSAAPSPERFVFSGH